ncbi:MAG: hypothetical protein GY810_29415 [Aureispira sp.]|nr:hypothetical protein [Aureispira sp.]
MNILGKIFGVVFRVVYELFIQFFAEFLALVVHQFIVNIVGRRNAIYVYAGFVGLLLLIWIF